MPPKLTIRDVAAKAMVSPATAARVLGSYGSVSGEVRARVLAAAQELGYRPNALARSMITRRTRTIGLLVPDICNTVFAAMVRGVQDVAKQNGYDVVSGNTDEDLDTELRMCSTLAERQVDGVILASAASSAGEMRRCLHGLPVVLIDRRVPGLDADIVLVDNATGAYQAVRHLIALGHKAIGIVTGPEQVATSRERLAGYERALRESGLEVDPAMVRASSLADRGATAVEELMSGKRRPTALFTANNVVTSGALLKLRQLGLRIPSDVALVGFDDLELGELLQPPLTAVSQPAYAVGTTAAHLLLRRLGGGQRVQPPPEEVVFMPKLLIRGSCGVKANALSA